MSLNSLPRSNSTIVGLVLVVLSIIMILVGNRLRRSS